MGTATYTGCDAEKTPSQTFTFPLHFREDMSMLLQGHFIYIHIFFLFLKLKHNAEIGVDGSQRDSEKTRETY